MTEEVREWLDGRIEAYESLGKEFNPEGDMDYYRCPRCIMVHPSDKSIHISNIEMLASYAGLPVRLTETVVEGKFCEVRTMKYRGYEFFEWRNVK